MAPEIWFLTRALGADDHDDIAWVAQGMRQTLIEVEGEAQGTALYDMDWLQQRVRFHLDPVQATAEVRLAGTVGGTRAGYTIVRAERDDAGQAYGLISTTYVQPEFRRHGLSKRLLSEGEAWFRAHGLPSAATWTSSTNAKLIGLYQGAGYAVDQEHVHEVTGTRMIRLHRRL
jgi:GNAT superfamily N-acetyltransferase